MPDDMSTRPGAPLPPDDPARDLALVHPDDDGVPHVAVAGGTYTILLSGADTGGRYALIDMLVPPGAGPPLHRHDYEEVFHVVEGEVELTFRAETVTARGSDGQRPGQRAARVPERVRCPGPAPQRRRAAGGGGPLPRRREPRRGADVATAGPQRGRASRAGGEGESARVGVPDRGPGTGLRGRAAHAPAHAERGDAYGMG